MTPLGMRRARWADGRWDKSERGRTGKTNVTTATTTTKCRLFCASLILYRSYFISSRVRSFCCHCCDCSLYAACSVLSHARFVRFAPQREQLSSYPGAVLCERYDDDAAADVAARRLAVTARGDGSRVRTVSWSS